MAHFAEVKNTDNKVLRVVVISNDDVDANGGDYHSDAEVFVQNLLGNTSVTGGTYWKQCSYNENERGTYPGPGSTWDADNNRFSPPQDYANWVFDSDNNKWNAPFDYTISAEDAAKDGDKHRPYWDASRNTWVCRDLSDTTVTVDGEEKNILEFGFLLPDDWSGVMWYWDNDTTSWVKIS
jgi:hypothetical protein